MKLTKLPEVASSFYTDCKKCEVERYHKVLSHSSEIAAKIECEVCGGKKTFKLTTTKKKAVTKRKVTKKVSHEDSYQQLMDKAESTKTESYSMKGSFKVDTVINHPKFGLGLVTEKSANSIEVMFPESFKNLVHNRL